MFSRSGSVLRPSEYLEDFNCLPVGTEGFDGPVEPWPGLARGIRAVLMRGPNQTAVMVLIGPTAAEEPGRILIRERGAISNLAFPSRPKHVALVKSPDSPISLRLGSGSVAVAKPF
ncbi:hypothetical protein F2P79_012897 [Pimephales promelas]|nr:hypothetical protein F2P79_012897 [Pimephales promelas]